MTPLSLGGVVLSFTFEVLSAKDLDQCASLVLSSMKRELHPMHRDKETIKRLIYGTHAFSLIAKRNGRMVGIISGTLFATPRIGLLSVFDEKSAREGLSNLLINEFIKAVKKQMPKATHVTTSLAADNTDAVSLYSALGFKVEGFLREGMMGKDIVFMRKRL